MTDTSSSETTLGDPPVSKRLWGKYRGTVVENTDPFQKGRLLVSVPGVLTTNWAMPCVPLTDVAMGTFMRPRIGANIWVEFERGDPDKPIWVGCYWGDGETPLLAKAANAVPPTNSVLTLETATSGISISDIPIPSSTPPGTVIIRAGGVAATISLTPAGVTITAPTINFVAATHFTVTAPNFTVI
ncbi:MAG: phage baseplate assembly protein V [Solirubrobacteraceae bacterium]